MSTSTVSTTVQETSMPTVTLTPGFSLFETISTIGMVSVLGACIYIGRKLQVLEGMDECVKKIKANMNVISSYLTRHHNKFNPAELQTLSPVQLTEGGKNFIISIGFNNVFQEHKTDFFDFIQSENVRLKYDVEVAAIKSIYAMYDKEYMEFLKVYFYNNPTRSLEDTAPTLGVYIRDAYLLEHPEITQ